MESLLALLEANPVAVAVVPANCTDRLQPLDVSINKEFFIASFKKGTENRSATEGQDDHTAVS